MINKRRATKTLTWRIVATLTTASVAYSFTEDLSTATWVGGVDALVKMILYYWHEWVWEGK